jgi:HKD family nuclease
VDIAQNRIDFSPWGMGKFPQPIRYWLRTMDFLHQPARSNRLGEFLLDNLKRDWTTFRAAVAFVKRSGTRHVAQALAEFSSKSKTEIIAGINHRGTSKEGLEDLMTSVGVKGRLIIFHNPLAFTFHPKIYLFKSEKNADLLVGSGNLTEGGLFTNYEAAIRLQLDLSGKDQAAFLQKIEDALDDWSTLATGSAKVLDADLLTRLVARGDVPVEALAAAESGGSAGDEDEEEEAEEESEPRETLFTGHAVPRAPSIGRPPPSTSGRPTGTSRTSTATVTATTSTRGNRGFVMVLQNTDVGVGQTTRGTSRRSPEIFIPLRARDADPDFWKWPNSFIESRTKFDRTGVKMRLGTQNITVNMMCWKLKRDFRLRNEMLRSAGGVGDILRMEKAPEGRGFDYYVEVVPQGTALGSG